jgi:hypothetical protein
MPTGILMKRLAGDDPGRPNATHHDGVATDRGGNMTGSRARVVTLAAVFATVILAGSAAWACSPARGAAISSQPQSGLAGTQVSISGAEFAAASTGKSGVVEIRWNGVGGTLLAETAGPDFSQTITIPNVAANVYTINAIQRDLEGNIIANAATAFAVTTPGAPAPSAPTASTPADPAPTAPAPAPAPTQAAPAPSAQAAPAVSTAAPAPAPAPTQSRTAAPAPKPAAPAAATPAPAAPAPAAAPTEAASPEPAAAPVAAEPVTAVPSDATASGDLWRGFESTGSLRGPGLAGDPASAGSGAGSWIGAALLAAGTIALLSTFSVLGLRRRRVTAERQAE